jgi:hypothetical protein
MPTAPAPVQYPLGPPVVSGSNLTVDMALDQPTRITRRIADLTLQRFIVSQIFATGGAVTGGAVVYDQALLNELYTDRDVEQVAPGDEFPIVSSSRQTPQVAQVEKWGGKIFVTDEARDRNDIVHFNNEVTKLANTIVRKVNTRAVATLDAAITAQGGAGTFVGHSWSSVVTGGASQTNNSGWPAADLAAAQLAADVDELGVIYDLWLVNPAQRAQLAIVYGAALADVLASYGIEMYASNRITAGTAYAVARGQVGEIRVEKALGTEVWREPKNERTWVQSSVRPVMYVTNPYSIRKVTGLS